MGKGDRRTKKGKIFNHSFGNSRPKATKKKVAAKPAPAKSTKAAKKSAK